MLYNIFDMINACILLLALYEATKNLWINKIAKN